MLLFLELCEPGEYSNNGMQPCKMCPKGQYSVDTGATTCKYCPTNYTTEHHRSTSHADCQGIYSYSILTTSLINGI